MSLNVNFFTFGNDDMRSSEHHVVFLSLFFLLKLYHNCNHGAQKIFEFQLTLWASNSQSADLWASNSQLADGLPGLLPFRQVSRESYLPGCKICLSQMTGRGFFQALNQYFKGQPKYLIYVKAKFAVI